MSLQLRLIFSILAVLVVSLVLGGALACWHASRSVEAELAAALEVGQHSVENALGQLSRTEDAGPALTRLIRTFDGDRHVLAILVNGRGEPALVSSLAAPPRAVPEPFIRLLGVTPQVLRFPLPASAGGSGAILLQTDLRNEVGEVWGEFGDGLALLGLFSLLILLSVPWIVRRSLAPLEAALRSFERIGAGDYGARLVPAGPPELMRLAQGFNRMAERLVALEGRNRRLHEQLERLQEEERADLARDLHDEIGPFLFTVGVDAAALPQLVADGRQDEIAERIATIRESVSHMQRQVKTILGRLRPADLLGLGLAEAVETLAQFWRRRRPDLALHVELTLDDRPRGDQVDGAIYRIVQEGLSNAVRHGSPHRIDVVIGPADGDRIGVSVVDDGGGLDGAGLDGAGTGFGLIGMTERVASLGGTLEIGNRRDGRGVRLAAILPRFTHAPFPQVPAEAS